MAEALSVDPGPSSPATADAVSQSPSPAPSSSDDNSPQRLRYRMLVSYDGALFHGWQKQIPRDGEPRRTVQGVVEDAIIRALQQPIILTGASRTDAGVHALGQVAQFDAATRIPLNRLAQAINARLPEDVEVRHVQIAPRNFNAIGGAVSKQYRYRIFNASRRPLHQRLYTYHCWWNLDIAAMTAAAQLLLGTHDFSAFAGAGSPRQSNVRTIHHLHVQSVPSLEQVHIVVAGSGFLYNMVRILAGTLLEVGRGAMPPDQIIRALTEKDRRLAGPTLPPQGLWLEWIRYPDDPPHLPSAITSSDSSLIHSIPLPPHTPPDFQVPTPDRR